MKVKILPCLLFFFMGIHAEGQANSQNVFDVIPESRRARLVERLNLAVAYQRHRNWAGIYDLLDRPVSDPNNLKVKNRGQYIEQNRRLDASGSSVLLEFTPEDVLYIGNDMEGFAVVFGCGKYRKRGREVKYKSRAEIYLRGGEWYFSAIPGPSLDLHAGPFPCNSKNRR